MIFKSVVINGIHKLVSLVELEEILKAADKIILDPKYGRGLHIETIFLEREKNLFLFEDEENQQHLCDVDEIVNIILN